MERLHLDQLEMGLIFPIVLVVPLEVPLDCWHLPC